MINQLNIESVHEIIERLTLITRSPYGSLMSEYHIRDVSNKNRYFDDLVRTLYLQFIYLKKNFILFTSILKIIEQ